MKTEGPKGRIRQRRQLVGMLFYIQRLTGTCRRQQKVNEGRAALALLSNRSEEDKINNNDGTMCGNGNTGVSLVYTRLTGYFKQQTDWVL